VGGWKKKDRGGTPGKRVGIAKKKGTTERGGGKRLPGKSPRWSGIKVQGGERKKKSYLAAKERGGKKGR